MPLLSPAPPTALPLVPPLVPAAAAAAAATTVTATAAAGIPTTAATMVAGVVGPLMGTCPHRRVLVNHRHRRRRRRCCQPRRPHAWVGKGAAAATRPVSKTVRAPCLLRLCLGSALPSPRAHAQAPATPLQPPPTATNAVLRARPHPLQERRCERRRHPHHHPRPRRLPGWVKGGLHPAPPRLILATPARATATTTDPSPALNPNEWTPQGSTTTMQTPPPPRHRQRHRKHRRRQHRSPHFPPSPLRLHLYLRVLVGRAATEI